MKTRKSGARKTKPTVTQRCAPRSSGTYVTKKKHIVTGRRQTGRLAHETHLIAKVMDHLAEAVVILDAEFRVASVNPAFTAITGYTAKDVTGRAPPFLPALRRDKGLYAAMRTALAGAGRWEGEVWDARRNGEAYAERLSIAAIADAGGVRHYAAVITDVTRRKADEERIRYQANFDALTGLPNRALFLDRLSQALPTMARAGARLGLMFIDLDGFKLVNDTLGHDLGDHLLREAAARLGKCVRSGDTVARLGGDEFTVIMPNLHEPRDAPLVATRVLEALAKPFDLNGHEAFVSASIGITVFPDDARDANGLLRNADTAMYRAKEQGKANFQFFTAELNREVKERLIVKNGLSKALERGEFSLYYQPKLDLKSGRITSVEALMRWHNRDLGMVSPARFIPVLEETGLVVEVGAWAIRTACAQHKAWKEAGLPPVRVAVNLSARQLREISFVTVFERALKESGVGPEGLEIEITESMLMSDSARTVVALRDLSDMGVRIAMDDFGTGYSSLSYLRRFPIDTIKIDRSFVADIVSNPDDAEIIRTIITMGQTLNRWVVAEGVETEEQMALLKSYTCDEIQGYYLSPPLPADKLTRFLQERMLQAAWST